MSSHGTSLAQDSLGGLPIFSSAPLPPIPTSTSLTSPHITHTPREILFPNPSLPAVLPHSTLTSHSHPITFRVQATPPPSPTTHTSTQLPQSTSTGTETAAPSSKRTTVLSKLLFNMPSLSLSQNSTAEIKCDAVSIDPVTEDSRERVGERESDTPAKEASSDSAKLQVSPLKSSTSAVPLSTAARAVPLSSTETFPAAADQAKTGVGTVEEYRELQCLSQVSLAQSTHTRTKTEGKGGRKIRSKISVPPVRNSEQQKTKRETLPIRTVDKSRQAMPALPRRRQRDRQTLVPSKGKL